MAFVMPALSRRSWFALIAAIAGVALAVGVKQCRSGRARDELRDHLDELVSTLEAETTPKVGFSAELARISSGGAQYDHEAVEASAATLREALAVAPDRRTWRVGVVPDNQGDGVVTPEQRAALAAHIAEWLALRAAGDPDAYGDWRRSQGYRLRDDDLDNDARAGSYEYYTGALPPEGIAPDQLFRVLWENSLSRHLGALRPAHIAAPEMRFARCIEEVIEHDMFPNEPSDLWWSGRSVAPSRRHWLPPITYEQVLERDGEALCAGVYVATRSAKGGWVTYKIYAYYDSAGGQWHIDYVAFSPLNRSTAGITIEL